jgi:hypothetical protein
MAAGLPAHAEAETNCGRNAVPFEIPSHTCLNATNFSSDLKRSSARTKCTSQYGEIAAVPGGLDLQGTIEVELSRRKLALWRKIRND